MYNVNDRVRVFSNNKLEVKEYIITKVSDDEETFQLTSIDGGITIENIARESIVDEWDTEKLAIKLIQSNTFEVDEPFMSEDEDEELIASDSTIEGLAMSFHDSFENVTTLYSWWKQAVWATQYYKDEDMYYLISKEY